MHPFHHRIAYKLKRLKKLHREREWVVGVINFFRNNNHHQHLLISILPWDHGPCRKNIYRQTGIYRHKAALSCHKKKELVLNRAIIIIHLSFSPRVLLCCQRINIPPVQSCYKSHHHHNTTHFLGSITRTTANQVWVPPRDFLEKRIMGKEKDFYRVWFCLVRRTRYFGVVMQRHQ